MDLERLGYFSNDNEQAILVMREFLNEAINQVINLLKELTNKVHTLQFFIPDKIKFTNKT